MSSLSSWLRVVAGLQKVASAAATQYSQKGRVLVTRVTQHGVDLAVNSRKAAAAATTATTAAPTASAFSSTTSNDSVAILSKGPPFEPEPRSMKLSTDDETMPITTVSDNKDQPLQQRIRPTHTRDDEPVDVIDLPLSVTDNTILTPHDEKDTRSSNDDDCDDDRYQRLREGRRVPSTRLGRAFGFASLGVGLAFGAAAELSSRLLLGGNNKDDSTSSSLAASDANANRLAETLCRMRGAALKLGQMLSIQDETLLPPALSKALEQVRQGADAMPNFQLIQQLESQLGTNWRQRLVDFDEVPFAAASIGQVHRAKVLVVVAQHDSELRNVVMKVQYPGVANSIESDLRNLQMLINLTGLAPPGLFIEEVMRVGRKELKQECNYLQEMENQLKFKELVGNDAQLSRERFVVPGVYKEWTTSQILTSDYVHGGTIDKVAALHQEERNRIAYNILYLTMQELFVWRFMQTDPNWGNFLYDNTNRTTYLIDFGAAREYSKTFVDGYLRIVCANANQDEYTLMRQSHAMKFLTGDENDIMREAHKLSGFTVGEPFWSDEPFDFRRSNISTRLSQHSSAFLQHRLTPPPEEVYTLHRKLAGAYNLCIKLGAVIPCRQLLRQIVENHVFDDEMDPPILD